MHITAEQLDEALVEVNRKYKVEGGHFEIARGDKQQQETVQAFRDFFFPDEPICKSIELEWSDTMETFVSEKVKENMSLIAVNDETGEVMGIRISGVSKEDEEAPTHLMKDEKVRKVFEYLDYVNKQADFFNKYGVSEAIEFIALAVGAKYRKLGLGTKLMSGALDLFRHLKLDSMYVKSIGSSNFSQRIFEKVGFETMFTMEYKDYIVDGEVVLNNTGVHKTSVNYVIKV